jgi:hypothetical protein
MNAIRTIRSRSWPIYLLASFVIAAFVLGLAWQLADHIPGWSHSADTLDVSADALEDYIPEDSAAVLALNLRQMREALPAQRDLQALLDQLQRRARSHWAWLDLLRLDPLTDLDRLRISFAHGHASQPLWLARGRFDRARFRIGPGLLQQHAVDHATLYQYDNRADGTATTIAPVADMLVGSDAAEQVLTALVAARQPKAEPLQDETLRQLLCQVDRSQTLWLAVSLRKLGPVPRMGSVGLELVLRPILTNASSIEGGITCGDELQAGFHFQADTDEGASKLEDILRSICEVAQNIPQLPGLDKEFVPLFRLLASGQVRRDKLTVSLRCRQTRP